MIFGAGKGREGIARVRGAPPAGSWLRGRFGGPRSPGVPISPQVLFRGGVEGSAGGTGDEEVQSWGAAGVLARGPFAHPRQVDVRDAEVRAKTGRGDGRLDSCYDSLRALERPARGQPSGRVRPAQGMAAGGRARAEPPFEGRPGPGHRRSQGRAEARGATARSGGWRMRHGPGRLGGAFRFERPGSSMGFLMRPREP